MFGNRFFNVNVRIEFVQSVIENNFGAWVELFVHTLFWPEYDQRHSSLRSQNSGLILTMTMRSNSKLNFFKKLFFLDFSDLTFIGLNKNK